MPVKPTLSVVFFFGMIITVLVRYTTCYGQVLRHKTFVKKNDRCM